MGHAGLSFLAGALSTLSPCVLPVLPLVVGGAFQEHRFGPLALAGGLIFSSTVLGFFMATTGDLLGFSPELIKTGSAVLLVLSGAVLMSQRLQELVTHAFSPISRVASRLGARSTGSGLSGQIYLGSLLGAVWSPCAGPTLGAAVGIATQVGHRMEAFSMMLAFSLGAAAPLIVIAYSSRSWVKGNLPLIRKTIGKIKLTVGGLVAMNGLLILSGLEESVEAALLRNLPDTWIHWITSI